MDIFNVLQIIIGFIGLILIAVPFSDNYKIINFKFIAYGILAQIILAVVLLKIPFIISIFEIMGNGVVVLQEATVEGASFVFGYATEVFLKLSLEPSHEQMHRFFYNVEQSTKTYIST